MSFLNLPVRTLVAACGLSLLSLAAHADSFRGDAHAPQQAAVATPHPAATVAGLETLANGGNAFDAAAAIAAALAVAEPYGSGLGGGGFFLLRQAGAQPTYRFLDARERAPKAAYADMYRRNGKVDPRLSVDGPLAAAIPGLPAALVELSGRYGRKPLADNLVPAIRLAVDGVSVDRVYRDRVAMRLEAMRKDPETARIFLDKGGIPDEWNLLRQPQLARTLERLGRYGRIGFYEGETADKLLTGVRAGGGIWSAADLRDYRVIERRPLEVKLANGRELISAPPPSAGGVALAQSLQMLEQLPWQKAEPVQRAHYVLEVLRRAYRDRGLLGDPDFVANPLPSLLAPDYLKRLAAGIDPRRATPSSALPEAPAWREGDHTTHFAVIDAQGNAVAATLSVNLPFGAAFTVPGTGVVLNNEMDDFAADTQGAGRQPGERGGGRQAPAIEHEPELPGKPDRLRRLRHPWRQPYPEHGADLHAAVLRRSPGRPMGRRAALPPPVQAGRRRVRTARLQRCRGRRTAPARLSAQTPGAQLRQPAGALLGQAQRPRRRRQRPARDRLFGVFPGDAGTAPGALNPRRAAKRETALKNADTSDR